MLTFKKHSLRGIMGSGSMSWGPKQGNICRSKIGFGGSNKCLSVILKLRDILLMCLRLQALEKWGLEA